MLGRQAYEQLDPLGWVASKYRHQEPGYRSKPLDSRGPVTDQEFATWEASITSTGIEDFLDLCRRHAGNLDDRGILAATYSLAAREGIDKRYCRLLFLQFYTTN